MRRTHDTVPKYGRRGVGDYPYKMRVILVVCPDVPVVI
jgi:hypothetical protein